MASTGAASEVRYSYPLHAILVVVLVWAVFLGLIAVYTTVAIALFPLSPFVALAGAGLVGMAHQYAISVRTPIKS
jgi:hypothetical protein